MTLPRQNSRLVDDDGRPTREFYDWMRRLETAVPTEEAESILNDLANVNTGGLSDGDVLAYDASLGIWTNGPAVSATQAALGAPVSLTTTGTWYDGPSLSLTEGTWVVNGHVSLTRSTATLTTWEARITDGTTHYASSSEKSPALVDWTVNIGLTTVITLTSTTTIKIQATTNAGAAACVMGSTTLVNGVGNATKITAIKVS